MRTHAGVSSSALCLPCSTPRTHPRQPLSPAGPGLVKPTLSKPQPHQPPSQLHQRTTHLVPLTHSVPPTLTIRQVQHGSPRSARCTHLATQQGSQPTQPALLRRTYGHLAKPRPIYSWGKHALRPSPPTRPSPPPAPLTSLMIKTRPMNNKVPTRPSPLIQNTFLL